MRVVFFGTPAFAVPSLEAIAASRHTLAGVVTQPDRARGRGQKVTLAPVKARAVQFGVPVLQPTRLRSEDFLAAFDALRADLCVVAAYGRLLPQVLLDRPSLGMVNVHASLLPRWRGAAPIQRAIMAGDAETGITIMRVVLELDAGPMLARSALAVGPNETSVELEHRLAALGAQLVMPVVDALNDGRCEERAQDESQVTYAARVTRADGDVDWARPAVAIHNQIRGLHPWPHATVALGTRRLQLMASLVEHTEPTSATPGEVVHADATGLVVATAPGAVRILRLKPEGRPSMDAGQFLNGYPVHPGDRMTVPVRTA